MIINDESVHAEVSRLFQLYEDALVSNNVVVLDELFWADERTIRYGGAENLYGSAEILAFRKARSAQGLSRQLSRTVITTYGADFATCSTLFERDNVPGKIGRQMQTWVRMPVGWRIVAAHVSVVTVA